LILSDAKEEDTSQSGVSELILEAIGPGFSDVYAFTPSGTINFRPHFSFEKLLSAEIAFVNSEKLISAVQQNITVIDNILVFDIYNPPFYFLAANNIDRTTNTIAPTAIPTKGP
jgi:hypothetical protein